MKSASKHFANDKEIEFISWNQSDNAVKITLLC